jgi:ankyrin repeat protein
MLAAQGHHLDYVKALIPAGADLNIVHRESKIALYYSIRDGNKEIVDALLEGGALPEPGGTKWPAAYTAAYWRQVDILKDFIERRFDIGNQGYQGWTPLHECYDSPQIASLLLTIGAKTDTLNEFGISPVELPIQNGYPETITE